MPLMDGSEANKIGQGARRSTGGSHVPYRGHDRLCDERRQGQVLAAGMDGYVSKPIDPQELFDTIESLCSREETQEKPLDPAVQRTKVLDRTKILDRVGGDAELLKEIVASVR